jgi:hypothetical protein
MFIPYNYNDVLQQVSFPGRLVPGHSQALCKINKNQYVPVSATIFRLGCFNYNLYPMGLASFINTFLNTELNSGNLGK